MTAITTASKPPQSGRVDAESPRTAWAEFVRVYPLYVALSRQFELENPPYANGAVPTPWADRKSMRRDVAWLEAVDSRTEAVHLRHLLATPSGTKEEALRAFIQRQLLKTNTSTAHRDKIDLLVVQYFALCATPEMIAAGLNIPDVAAVLQPILGEVKITSLECCEPLDRILTAAQECRCLQEFVDRGLLDQGRLAKEAAGDLFYEPAGLVSFCRFNFIFRRYFIQLLHGDLRAIHEALIELERRGVKVVDCRRSGLSANEPVAKLREFQQRWKAPFKSDYAQPAAFRSYDQLVTLRADLDDVLAGRIADAPGAAGPSSAANPTNTASDGTTGPAVRNFPESRKVSSDSGLPVAQIAASGSSPAAVSPLGSQVPRAALTADECEEKIWEQLIATPRFADVR